MEVQHYGLRALPSRVETMVVNKPTSKVKVTNCIPALRPPKSDVESWKWPTKKELGLTSPMWSVSTAIREDTLQGSAGHPGIKTTGTGSLSEGLCQKENGEPIVKDWVSKSKEEDEPKFQTVKPNFTKTEFVKPEIDRKPSDFEMVNKACHVCGSFDHLKNNCNYWYINGRFAKPLWTNAQMETDPILHIMKKLMEDLLPFEVILKEGKLLGKGIEREFSVVRTPQQNEVAERKNRTLIEVARTMLADSKLPTTFWAEAVNTVCYVQNRVLVIKPHNKTPYELFLGRKHALSFMRSFGCPVTILNTIDHLGKFDGTVDEGFFVGYSTNSKVFRVFNNRTRIVEENLHVKFRNQSNGSAGTKACDNIGKTRVETVPDKDYILLPLWTQDPSFSSSLKGSPGAGFKPSEEEEKKDVEDSRNEDSEVPITEELRVNQENDANVNNTNNINTVSPTDNAAGIEDNAVDENIVYRCADEPNMPELKDISIFEDSNEDVFGAEADLNNLESTFQCKKQTVVVNSTTEAEYVAALSCCGQVLWIQNQLLDYGERYLEWNGKAAKDEIVYTSFIEHFWTTKKAKNINGEAQIHANIDRKKVIISEASIKRDLRFVQVFLNNQLEGMDNHTRNYVIPSHKKKVFGNIRRVGKDFSGKITPLFPTMMVQAQEEIEHVANKAVNEEMDDSLERATTIATSLDAEQDRGNISKTQSKETPPSSLGTSSGGGPRRPDTMGDTIAQTRSENVSKFSNDPLLAGVNTPQSREDILKLTELMKLCSNLQQRVFDLETIKTSQAQEITSLKKRVKRLEKKMRSRTHGLKRLYKVGLSLRVESSANEESLGEEDASKQGMISDIDANQDIYLVNVHRDEDIFSVNDQDDTSMFDVVKDLQGEEVVVEKEVVGKDVSVVKEVNVTSIATSVTATTITAATTPTISMDEITFAKALIEIKTSRPKAKGIVMQDPSETPTPTPISSSQQPSKEDIQAKVDANYQLTERLQAEEQEQLIDAEKAKLFMEFIEKRRKLFAAKRTAEKRNNPSTKAQQRSIMSTYLKNMNGWKTKDGNSQMYLTFNKILKNFDREDLEVLWRLVKDVFVKTMLVDHVDSFLMHNLKTMFEHHVEDNNTLYNLLVEKMYPLTHHTLHQMINNVKLQVDYECKIDYELLRLLLMKKLEILKINIKFREGLWGLKVFMKLLLLRYEIQRKGKVILDECLDDKQVSNQLKITNQMVAEVKARYGNDYKSITCEQINDFLDEFNKRKKEIVRNKDGAFFVSDSDDGDTKADDDYEVGWYDIEVKGGWVLPKLIASTSNVIKVNRNKAIRKNISSEVKRPNSDFK
uniref:Ribonuclease H-like domain-containing protein n=1 Tax=Tanacetum cinerariifolium TaxID=118510 RepID=A0A6L2JRL2_TANCI|nr:ribonuclease H-like domain-containing protein [Tanacetum cinerariifolium]